MKRYEDKVLLRVGWFTSTELKKSGLTHAILNLLILHGLSHISVQIRPKVKRRGSLAATDLSGTASAGGP